MNVLGLFSGIGGFELGFERVGFTVAAMCEIDPYCRAVLAKHWPHVPLYDDVKTLTGASLAATGIVVDVITGGFPCQDISLAGKGAGLGGERSGLWTEYRRLIEEIAPRWVVIENVSALRSRGLDVVLGSLAAIGYDAEWHCIPASAVGAPHRRDRVWIIAHDAEWRRRSREVALAGGGGDVWRAQVEARGLCSPVSDTFSSQLWLESGRRGGQSGSGAPQPTVDGEEWDVADADQHPRLARWLGNAIEGARGRHAGGGGVGADVPDADGEGCAQSIGAGQAILGARARQPSGPHGGGWDFWLSEPDVGRVAHGVPKRVDRLRALGNAVVPQIPEMIARAILAAEAL